ncbi:MAG: hypothetical protein JKX97_00730 [Candidatus Lindowbacteria bacterium]|nr:hypothetical protein [Candidatus Lindowbacteria bacterium]
MLPALAELVPFLGITSDQIRRFTGGEIVFKVKDGWVPLTKPLDLHNEVLGIKATGRFGLDGSLDLNCEALIPTTSLVGKIGGSPLSKIVGLRRVGNRTAVPFRASGFLSAPKYTPEISTETVIKGVLGEVLNRAGVTSGDAQAAKSDTKPTETVESAEKNIKTEEVIFDAIKDLFSR